MSSSSVIFFLVDVFASLKEVGAQLLQFLNTQPINGESWTWGGIMFGTAFFAFLAYAIVRWLIP